MTKSYDFAELGCLTAGTWTLQFSLREVENGPVQLIVNASHEQQGVPDHSLLPTTPIIATARVTEVPLYINHGANCVLMGIA